MQMCGKDAVFSRSGLQDCCAGAVAENDACVPVLPISETRKRFRTHKEYSFVLSRPDEAVCNGKAIDKTRTRSIDIKSSGFFCIQAVLKNAGRRREKRIGGHGCDYYQVQLSRLEARVLQGIYRGLEGQV